MGVEGQSIWSYTQGVEEVGGSDALQRQNTLCTHRPHLLLGQTAVPQREDVCQRHILLWTQTHTYKYVQVSTHMYMLCRDYKLPSQIRLVSLI